MLRERLLSEERGSVIVMVAISAAILLLAGALAVDGGMLYSARAEAQHAADAAALAGASAFVDYGAGTAGPEARNRATEFASKNTLNHSAIDSNEVAVRIVPESSEVVVTIRRPAVNTWFMGLLGKKTVAISATSSARGLARDNATCVKPFAPSDIWSDADDDVNHNKLQDGSERWVFGSNPNDYYKMPTGKTNAVPPETGYGSNYRGPDLDQGRQIHFQPHGSAGVFAYEKWDMPTDPNITGPCSFSTSGANEMRSNMCNCNSSVIQTGVDYPIDGGTQVGPINQGTSDLVAQDPNAVWDPNTKTVVGSRFSPWWTSPRVVKVGLFAPGTTGGGKIRFTRFMVVFLEGQSDSQAPIEARFLHVVQDVRLVN